MEKTIIIGLDLAKNVFQAHGARADGSVAFRKKLTRNQVLAVFAGQPACLIAMEAPRQCASLAPVDTGPGRSVTWVTRCASSRRST